MQNECQHHGNDSCLDGIGAPWNIVSAVGNPIGQYQHWIIYQEKYHSITPIVFRFFVHCLFLFIVHKRIVSMPLVSDLDLDPLNLWPLHRRVRVLEINGG